MISRAATSAILEGLIEPKTIETKVMIGWEISGALWQQQARLTLDRLGLSACRRG
jgi:hypothetical protein